MLRVLVFVTKDERCKEQLAEIDSIKSIFPRPPKHEISIMDIDRNREAASLYRVTRTPHIVFQKDWDNLWSIQWLTKADTLVKKISKLSKIWE